MDGRPEVASENMRFRWNITTGEGYLDNVIFNIVTMPAATGALLLSTKAGSRGYMYKHASFVADAAMTYKVLFWG